jgi:plastocyanin
VIHLGGYSFSPSTLTIAAGDSVRAVVDDGSHTFTGTAGPKTWDSGGLSAGDSYTVRLTSPGDYSFVCSYHQALGMTGSVHVQ